MEKKHDYTGTYFSRILEVPDHAVEYLKAIFLRTTCPLNYILTPKKNLQKIIGTVDKNDIGEDKRLLEYAMYKFSNIYGELYTDFLDRNMINKKDLCPKDNGQYPITIEYGLTVNNDSNQKNMFEVSANIKAQYLKAYLFDGYSFRKLEEKIMGIKSPARGGGFKAQRLIRSYNISNSQKGIFFRLTLEQAYAKADSPLREVLTFIKNEIKNSFIITIFLQQQKA